jgi:hypothetical protein
MQNITVETLQSQNAALREQNDSLRTLLEKAQTMAHYALKDAGSLEHRGIFHNCPSPDCVDVRVLIGKEER